MQIVERDVFDRIREVLETEEILVITGCRQAGKTSTLRYFYDKIDSSNKLFLDLENIVNRKYFEEEDYENIKRAFEFSGINFQDWAYIFLDEIQYVENIPSVVKYLKDHYKIKFFLTGSASFYLKNLFSESLVGRKYIFEIFPLTFKEFLAFKGFELKEFTLPLPKKIDKDLENLFLEYLHFGGFPAVALKDNPKEKSMKLKDIFSSYFEMEVIKLGDFAKLSKVRDLLLLLLQRSTSFVDISKLSSELGISRITTKEYIEFFKQTYFLDLIRPFTVKKEVEIRKISKVYPVDVGIAYEFGFKDEGGLFEIAVYQNLKTKHTPINYYRKKSGVEVDFIMPNIGAYETKLFAYPADTTRLKRISASLNIKEARVVSLRKVDLPDVIWAPYLCLEI